MARRKNPAAKIYSICKLDKKIRNIPHFPIQNRNPETVDCNSESYLLGGDQYTVGRIGLLLFLYGTWVSVSQKMVLLSFGFARLQSGMSGGPGSFVILFSFLNEFPSFLVIKKRVGTSILKTWLDSGGWGIFVVIVGAWQPFYFLFS